MFLQVIGLGKEFVAQYTGKGLLPTVILLMSFEVLKLLEILNTLHTTKRPLSSVNLNMFLQIYWLGNPLATMLAEIGYSFHVSCCVVSLYVFEL